MEPITKSDEDTAIIKLTKSFGITWFGDKLPTIQNIIALGMMVIEEIGKREELKGAQKLELLKRSLPLIIKTIGNIRGLSDDEINNLIEFTNSNVSIIENTVSMIASITKNPEFINTMKTIKEKVFCCFKK